MKVRESHIKSYQVKKATIDIKLLKLINYLLIGWSHNRSVNDLKIIFKAGLSKQALVSFKDIFLSLK